MAISDFSYDTQDVLRAIFRQDLHERPAADDSDGWQALADWIAEDDGHLDTLTRAQWDSAAEEISAAIPA